MYHRHPYHLLPRRLPLVILALLLVLVLPLQAQTDHDWMYADTIADRITVMPELLVTPDGSDPVTYILGQVYQRSLENRKRLTYSATANVQLIVRDADLIPKVMPRTLMLAAQLYLRTKGLWGLFDYFMSRQSVEAALRTHHTREKGGKPKYNNPEVLRVPSDMSKKVRQQLVELCEFDLFDELYGEETLVNPKYRQKFAIKYEGSFEENGKTIFVLKARRHHGELRETQTLHVVDREWGIRRAEFNTRIFRSYRECIPVRGTYMPYRKVDNPVQFNLEKAIEKGHEMVDKRKNPRRMEIKTLQRAEKLAKGERDYQPMIKVGYEIQYK